MRTRIRRVHDRLFPPGTPEERLRLALRDYMAERHVIPPDTLRDQRLLGVSMFALARELHFDAVFSADPRPAAEVAREILDEYYPQPTTR